MDFVFLLKLGYMGLRPACFLVTFCTMQKVTTRSLCREYRGFANLESAHRSRSFAPQQLKPFESLEVTQTLNQRTQTATSHNPIKSLPPLAAFAPAGAYNTLRVCTACSASKNAGKSKAFAGISHKFLISFLYTCTRHNADSVTDAISAIGNASHTVSTERVVTARINATGSRTPS